MNTTHACKRMCRFHQSQSQFTKLIINLCTFTYEKLHFLCFKMTHDCGCACAHSHKIRTKSNVCIFITHSELKLATLNFANASNVLSAHKYTQEEDRLHVHGIDFDLNHPAYLFPFLSQALTAFE